MELSRRRLLQAALLSAGSAALAACGSGSGSGADAKELTLWYWGGGLSDKVVADAVKHFTQTKLKPSVIGGDFKQKLVTTLNGRRFVPDITGIKGEDIASLLVQANRFIDLNTLGADKLASQFVTWKWKKGSTKDGKLIGFPIDIGPTAMFYRPDVFAKAGLPEKPEDVAAAMSTWEDYYAAGQKLKNAVSGTFMVQDPTGIFQFVVGQGAKRFIDESGKFIGDQDHVRRAWDLSVKPIQLGIAAPYAANDQDLFAVAAKGTTPSILGAAWRALDMKSNMPDSEGKWRVAAMPGGPANYGGSFLAIPKESRNPQLAFQIITWLLSPENQARGFTDAALFPSSPSAYALPALTAPDPYFGGQKTIEVFGDAAQKIPVQYEAPADAAVSAPFINELLNVWTKGKNPDSAWSDAVSKAKEIADRQGGN
ncbi:extracellular solute-binding protein [Planotetraspora sp. A-T 1434]|uniref:ABC transporter substrate-binding protein n=1 Tax=Planotetraspora sp. A-T 1434 TaxID=2979219 RepID=UPI0021C02A99|nr:extracellular solute-binding protein [Planotetraspora sp. A-T 1434]MCT9929682.1 extracellular solute-binding protein [Planotetraspora sp. A-T 1434]